MGAIERLGEMIIDTVQDAIDYSGGPWWFVLMVLAKGGFIFGLAVTLLILMEIK